MTDNPYQVPDAVAEQPRFDARRSSRALWIAYAFSPAVAPIASVIILFLLGGIFTAFGVEVNPASFLVLPVLALTVGMLVCYLVALIIGMPIAFYLRKRNALSGYTIHGAAFCCVVLFSTVVSTPMAIAEGAHWYHVPLAILMLIGVVSPPVLLSATCFWLLVRKYGGLSHMEAK